MIQSYSNFSRHCMQRCPMHSEHFQDLLPGFDLEEWCCPAIHNGISENKHYRLLDQQRNVVYAPTTGVKVHGK